MPTTRPVPTRARTVTDRRTARITGLLYLGLALTGMLGFLVVRNELFVPSDPDATLANLITELPLARAGIALELGVVITQALVSVWFYRLFRDVDSFAAGCLAAFGLVNAVTILASAAFLATALQIADDSSLVAAGDAAGATQLMYVISGNLWGVGSVFFGLWLVPMGFCVLRTVSMPRTLGWLLVVGGLGYVVSAFVTDLAPDASPVAAALVVPATVGELWIIGYLLVQGFGHAAPSTAVRHGAAGSTPVTPQPSSAENAS